MAMETSPSDTAMTDQAQTMSEMAYADEQVAPAWSSPAYRDGWYEDIDSGSQATLVANTEPEYTAATGTGYVDSESDSAMRASMFAAFGPAEQMAPSHEGDASIAQVSFTEVGADFVSCHWLCGTCRRRTNGLSTGRFAGTSWRWATARGSLALSSRRRTALSS